MKIKNNRPMIEIVVILVILLVSFIIFGRFDTLEKIVDFSKKYERYELDEIICTFIVLVFCLLIFSIRRWCEIIENRKIILKINNELQCAINEVKQLKGILPLCSFCKKNRNDSGYWEQVDAYLQEHTGAEISHSVCPECMKKEYPKEYASIYFDKNK